MLLFETRTGKPWDRRAVERGAKPAQIQQLMAHADISTTMLYTEVLAEDLADVAQLLEAPEHTGTPYAQPREGAR